MAKDWWDDLGEFLERDDTDLSFAELEYLIENGPKGGKPVDLMHEQTEKEIEKVRKRLAVEYKQAEAEMKEKTNKYLSKFSEEDNNKQQMVKDGKLSEDKYKQWRQRRICQGELYQQRVDTLSQYMVNADKQAHDIVYRQTLGVYANNYNYAKYEVEKGLKVNTSFTLLDKKTVERLASKNPKLLPDPSEKTKQKIREGKLQRWGKRKINNAIIQGVLQGDPIDRIADRLNDVTRMGWNSAVRNARTAITGAQNAGRLDSYKDSKRLGIKLRKQWMATLDERTRTSHQDLDGEIVDIDKTFSNKLKYPGDPDGHPREVYNCRCTMIADLPEFPPRDMQRLDNINGTPIENCTYSEWMSSRIASGEASSPKTFADKIKAIKNNTKLTEQEKIEQAGEVFADEIEKSYLSDMRKEQEWLTKERAELTEIQKRSMPTDELIERDEELKDRRRAFREKYSQEALRESMKDKLSQIRAVGFADENEVREHLRIKRLTDTGKAAITAYDHYPRDWIDSSIGLGKLKVKKVDRGYYSLYREDLALSGWSEDSLTETALHELGHRFEDAVPKIREQEREFYKRRTKGEKLEWIGEGYAKDERARKDKFIDVYMGKDYGGHYYELVSMGFEYAYTDPLKLSKDPEMQRWIYGMLCIL